MSDIIPIFYKIMKYPVPIEKEQYVYISESKYWKKYPHNTHNWTKFSREEPNERLKDYIEYINKRWRLYRSLPFVRQIYLCNSISFNALHDTSDIDIYIIAQHRYVWLARFFSVFMFRITKNKRSKDEKTKRFCLSFYTDEYNSNLYHLRHSMGDIYLPYWLAHAVLLYTDTTLPDDFLRENNKELLSYLPFHPHHQTICIWSEIYRWSNRYKRYTMKLIDNIFGRSLQYVIKRIWKIYINYKKNKLSRHIKEEIIVSDSMLKFHDDKRSLYQYRKNKYHKEISKW